jgi:predicted transcriptional regulator with HTH domain
LLQELLRRLLIVPEILRRSLLFDLRQLFPLRSYIKETSRAVPSASSALHNCCVNPVMTESLT